MRRFLLFIAISILSAAASAQSNRFPPINLYDGDPTGNACTGNTILQSSTTGQLYTCQHGALKTGTLPPGLTPDGANGITVTANIAAASVLSSVNGQINVGAPPYNARGDNGVTDNTTAINAACTAAKAFSPPAQVAFPKATGYWLTGPLTSCAGVSLKGQPSLGKALPAGGTILRSKPGMDIIELPDLNTAGAAPTATWVIEDINFAVDDTVDASASYPHRWPGRWTQDGTISLSTPTTITAAKQLWQCSDVGSAVNVKGAGVAGADLITTIASLPSCYGAQSTATLTDAASTAVTNVLVYTSVPGVSATQTIGNCAIAGDNFDGNSAHWLRTGYGGNNSSELRNVMINSVLGTTPDHDQHNSCGIYLQGAWHGYGFRVTHTNIARIKYAVVLGTVDTNPALGQAGADQQWWEHMNFNGVTYPWISYNGGYIHIAGWQLASNYGPMILDVVSGVEVSANAWDIQMPEQEQVTGGIAWIIRGSEFHLHNTQIMAAASSSYLESKSLTCDGCSARSGVGSHLYLNGYGNRIDIRSSVNNLQTPGTVIDNGINNLVTFTQFSSPFGGIQPSRPIAANISRMPGNSSSRSADFLTGNAATPYYNRLDLLFFPQDYLFANSLDKVRPVADATSFSGFYSPIKANDRLYGWSQFQTEAGNSGLVGTNIPASVVTVSESAKCPVQASYTFEVRTILPNALITSAVFSCSTTYATNSLVVDLSSYAGQAISWGWSGVTDEVDSAWSGIAPYAVSATPAKNTAPKTSAALTTLDPAWLPLPGASTIGGVQSKDCSGTGHVQKINTDGTVTCTADAAGGSGVACGTEWIAPGAKTTGQGLLNSANQTTLWSFTPSCTMSFTKISFAPSTADNSANTYDVGIYNANGSTLICHTGATAGTTFAPGTSAVTLSIGTCALTGGTRYIFAMTGVAITAILNGTGVNLLAVSRANVTTATSGGALNSTVTVPADSWASSNGFPMISLHN